jgi:hypothetical protein
MPCSPSRLRSNPGPACPAGLLTTYGPNKTVPFGQTYPKPASFNEQELRLDQNQSEYISRLTLTTTEK